MIHESTLNPFYWDNNFFIRTLYKWANELSAEKREKKSTPNSCD